MNSKEYWKKTREEKRDEYHRMNTEIRITDYAQMLGMTLVKKGRYYSLKEHDSVMIDPDKNLFTRNSVYDRSRKGGAGATIDFALEFSGQSMPAILKELSEMLEINSLPYIEDKNPYQPEPKKEVVNKEMKLPERDNNMNNVFAYLVRTRYINKNIVSEWMAKRMLYQDQHKNCVFVSRDEEDKPQYGFLRGTNTYKPFKGDLVGCNYEEGFYVDNKADKTIVTEAVIDGLSRMTLLKERGENYKDYNYLMLGSANKYQAVFNHMKKNPVSEWILSLDQDSAGTLFTDRIMEQGRELDHDVKFRDERPAFEKDWNDELKYVHENKLRPDYFVPSKVQYRVLLTYFVAKRSMEDMDKENPAAHMILDTAIEQLDHYEIPEKVKPWMDKLVNFYKNNRQQIDKQAEGDYIGYTMDCYNRNKPDMGIVLSLKQRQAMKQPGIVHEMYRGAEK